MAGLDEPFASLDAITRAEMQGWLASVLEAERRTVVLVTHDVEEAVVLADRVVVMSGRPGRAVAGSASKRNTNFGLARTAWRAARIPASKSWPLRPCA